MRSEKPVTYNLPATASTQITEISPETALRSYGAVLTYQCGLARQFLEPELGELYQERNMTCNWNTSWTTRDYLDQCVWTQCL